MLADFASLALSSDLQTVVAELGYREPTPIQTQSIPLLLAGKDVIAQSKTGSGKTAAFALPILQTLDIAQRSMQALLVCPTRELAAQVAREIRKLGRKHKGLTVLELVGGQPVKPQTSSLERGVHIVVGTPGRLLDHLDRGTLECTSLKCVVLDEADRMLDMGFGADVEAILNMMPTPRQTVLFSATFPDGIETISRRFQRNAERITIEDTAEKSPVVRQLVVQCDADEKHDILLSLLDRFPRESALIFCNFKSSVAQVQNSLAREGFRVARLDGDLEQFQRDQVMARFRNQSLRILIATDVAGRGIDVEDLELVINYELPAKTDIYVHRIGRTGRAGKSGLAISLASKRELSKISSIEETTGVSIEHLNLEREHSGQKQFPREALMCTILISGGRKDKIRPGDILGALTGEAGGLQGNQIGKIEIQDRLSYVAVARKVGRSAVASINNGRIKRKRFRASLID